MDKKFKDMDQTVWFLDEPEDAPTNVSDWVSTGSTILDLAVSNRPNGGYPVGKIIEINGLEGSGKSLLAAHAIAETQKRGGVGVFIDTESAVDPSFFEAIGVDTKNMLYVPAQTTEYIFEAMENIIASIRGSGNDRLVTIVVDSLAGASTKVEMDANYDKDGYATAKAIILSKAMRKITNLIAQQRILVILTNQLRQKLNAMAFADPWTTSGGKAVAFHSSIRIRLAAAGKLKNSDKDVIGIKIKAKVIKSRIGPPFRNAEIDMYFDSGIDHYSDLLAALKARKIISSSGTKLSFDLYDEKSGEVLESLEFTSKDFPTIIRDPKNRDYLYKKLCDASIMQYRKEGIETRLEDDIEVDNSTTEE